jgi:nitrate/nitrite transport system permease protein
VTPAREERLRTVVYSLVLLVSFLILWQGIAGAGGKGGKAAGIPGPLAVAETAWVMISDPFYDRGPNDKGFGLQLGYSLMRMMGGYLCASVVAILVGVALGSSPALFKAANPFIQIMKPISPLAWMPLFLYTLKNAGQAAVLVIFVSSLWPTIANTAFGVGSIKKDYLNLSRLLQLSWPRRFLQVILPAAAPAIVAGLRISIGSAWVAIVAAEMLIGGTGVGYFVWNEWNNLALDSVIFAIFAIGMVGVLLDFGLGRVAKLVAYSD